MKTDKRFNKWLILTVSISVLAISVFECAVAQEEAFSEALYANPPPLQPTGKAVASLQLADYSTRRNGIGSHNKNGGSGARHLLPEGLKFQASETAPIEMIGPLSFYSQPLAEPVAVISPKNGPQPLLGIGWDHDAGGCRKWNIAFGFGFYFTDYHDWRYPAEDFGQEEPASADRPSDLFDKIRSALEIIGFKIRYDF